MSRIFGKVQQNGYVVRDIHAAMDHWINVMGVGPWFHIEEIRYDWYHYRGKPSDLRATVALAMCGDLQMELTQPLNDAPSLYKDFFDAGLEGLHHIAFGTTTFEETRGRALAMGYSIGHEGCVGGPGGHFCFLDTGPEWPGTVIELSETGDYKKGVFEKLKAEAAAWDGSNPIRKLG
jgi:hypothetical protein